MEELLQIVWCAGMPCSVILPACSLHTVGNAWPKNLAVFCNVWILSRSFRPQSSSVHEASARPLVMLDVD